MYENKEYLDTIIPYVTVVKYKTSNIKYHHNIKKNCIKICGCCSCCCCFASCIYIIITIAIIIAIVWITYMISISF
jgi:hypothetical protein